MPYESVFRKPARVLRHRGITIYHAYTDDELSEGPHRHRFVTDPHEGMDMSFDVRELSNWSEPPHPPFITGKLTPRQKQQLNDAWKKYHDDEVEAKHIKLILKLAIQNGEINRSLPIA